MATCVGAAACAAIALRLVTAVEAAPQQAEPAMPVSLERIREGLVKPPPPRFDMPLQRPVATFKSRVDQRVYVLPLNDWIEKEFKLTALQRQSAAWAGQCCGGAVFGSGSYGVRLDPLFKSAAKALQRRKERKIREQVARELAALEAARQK